MYNLDSNLFQRSFNKENYSVFFNMYNYCICFNRSLTFFQSKKDQISILIFVGIFLAYSFLLPSVFRKREKKSHFSFLNRYLRNCRNFKIKNIKTNIIILNEPQL